ncbi:hypothetical protein [Rhizobium binae]|uniref:hypothetical protein n=1 Tax=Rhizobium binae TaxID=1138190 RepID=UPI001C82CBF9|nr:hypothetical protein [Rhizobium binae]
MTENQVPVWTPTGELTAVPPANDNVPAELRALGAAIGKVMPGEFAGRKYVMQPHSPYEAANDNLPLLIGITGKRNVGKSTVANLLEFKYGFERAHAFEGGKLAAEAYFRHITGDADIARRMVYGDLKDKPSPYLPGNVAPRYFLERFGHFMGDDLGVEWTLAMEIARIRRVTPNAPIVVESLVYEAPWFKAQGGFVLRLVRPDFEGPAGIASDSVQASIGADYMISASSVEELEAEAVKMIASLVGVEKALRRFG